MTKVATERALGMIAALGMFIVIFFLMPTMVGGATFDPNDLIPSSTRGRTWQVCNGNGYLNSTDKHCTCITGYHGDNCEYQYCPFGKSWLAPPVENNVRNTKLSPCSDMGYCDPWTGTCECRGDYEGRACERLRCPGQYKAREADTSLSAVAIGSSGVATFEPITLDTDDFTDIVPCAGHGRCMTLGDAASEFDGENLIRAPFTYDNWDAEKIQGCLCDFGWEGYDCSLRSCPKGRDPTLASAPYNKNEVLTLQCQADDGYFAILVRGSYTEPIPYDADPALLKYIIERVHAAGRVTIKMPRGANNQPSVCDSASIISTTIQFDDHPGNNPPIFLTTSTSNTRMWPLGGTPLTLGGGSPVLQMSTIHTLTCQACAACHQDIRFIYGNSVSDPVEVDALGASAAIQAAINGLEDLIDANWDDMTVDVSYTGATDQICNAGDDTTFTIAINSMYGNIPALDILDGTYIDSSPTTETIAANLTWTTNAGNGTMVLCSNQGVCDTGTGKCLCFFDQAFGETTFQLSSSDGNGNSGTRGDCGYLEVDTTSCYSGGVFICSPHAFCSNSTGKCECLDGWHGIDCSLKTCPLGPALFDEPTRSDVAHALAECSGAGVCARQTGTCTCRPGFTGPNCAIKDCVRDPDTFLPCSGHGACVSIAEYYDRSGFTYGNPSTEYATRGSSNWDAFNWFECICSAALSIEGVHDIYHVPVEPQTLVSGVPTYSRPLPGWGSFDCSKRNCPRGDDTTMRGNFGGELEIQRVSCLLDPTADPSNYMQFTLWGLETDPIYVGYNAAEIKKAIERHRSIGNVSVWFPIAESDATDGIFTACSDSGTWASGTGGFLVKFLTEFGDIPLLTESTGISSTTVSEYVKGTNANLECSGSRLGFCDRDVGVCVCNKHQISSNGSNAPGAIGDCSYFAGEPWPSDTPTVFENIADFS